MGSDISKTQALNLINSRLVNVQAIFDEVVEGTTSVEFGRDIINQLIEENQEFEFNDGNYTGRIVSVFPFTSQDNSTSVSISVTLHLLYDYLEMILMTFIKLALLWFHLMDQVIVNL